MILQGDKLKNHMKEGGISSLQTSSPAIRCHFDNGQEFYGKNRTKPLFSWHCKGDFHLPIIPFLVTVLAALALLSTAKHALKHKKKH
ncbi:MAG: hypothetical protein IJW46_03390 [Clostridia bacterium]|nr:hypothetical protein [Clostridia bacterium]